MADFQVGDKVAYPPHGAGTVIKREQRDGVDYLSIEIKHSKMTLMVPSESAADKGVRAVMKSSQVKAIMATLGEAGSALADNPQHRLRESNEKAKTGGAAELAAVIRDLNNREVEGKKLSPGEQKTLQSAKDHLASELVFVKDISVEDAHAMIEKALPRFVAE